MNLSEGFSANCRNELHKSQTIPERTGIRRGPVSPGGIALSLGSTVVVPSKVGRRASLVRCLDLMAQRNSRHVSVTFRISARSALIVKRRT